METLFRFLMARPPEAKDQQQDALLLSVSSQFYQAIDNALDRSDAPVALAQAAQQFSTVDQKRVAAGLLAEGAVWLPLAETLRQQGPTKASDLRSLAASSTGMGFPELQKAASNAEPSLGHVLAGIKYSGRGVLQLESWKLVYKTLRFLDALAQIDDEAILDPKTFLARTLIIDTGRRKPRPANFLPVPTEEKTEEDRKEQAALADVLKRRDALRQRVGDLRTSVTQLTRVAPADLLEEPEKEPAPATPPKDTPRLRIDDAPIQPLTIARVRMSPDAVARLPATVRSAAASVGVALADHDLPQATEKLSSALRDTSWELAKLETNLTPRTRITAFGGHLVQISGVKPGELNLGGLLSFVPLTHGNLKPAGIGDLLVVKQQLKRYEAREISHIENVLKGELKSREHKRSRTTEETQTLERETIREEERDQQTTERFELQRETENIIKDDMSLKIGASVSGSYGPMVEFKTNTDFGMSSSEQESTKVASTYSKEITSRAVSKVSERVREQFTLKITETVEEANVHELNNTSGAEHVIGQYQWVDKIYEAQVYNYGKRMLFDFIIPEPAAFLTFAMTNTPKPGADLEEPIPFTLTSFDIDEGNYALYAQLYGADGIEPPPAPYIHIAKTFEGIDVDEDERGMMTKVAEVPINEGYAAISATVIVLRSYWTDEAKVRLSVGAKARRFTCGSAASWNATLAGEVGSIGIGIQTWRVASFAASVEIYCARTDRELERWKVKTHAAIRQAYENRLREYEDDLARAKAEAATEVPGRNPVENRLMERAELKKHAIAILTAQQFDSFGSIKTGNYGYPELKLAEAEAEGRYIRFFEQALEWEQMMYLFYPYYWGRKKNWAKVSLLADDDPQFAEFMKAGAARVVVSVRPGFELAVAHFLETGQIWEGGDPPDVTSPTYLNIIDEIKERTGAEGDEIPQGNPWDVRIPTALIKLRHQETLPAWIKNGQGEWVEAN